MYSPGLEYFHFFFKASKLVNTHVDFWPPVRCVKWSVAFTFLIKQDFIFSAHIICTDEL